MVIKNKNVSKKPTKKGVANKTVASSKKRQTTAKPPVKTSVTRKINSVKQIAPIHKKIAGTTVVMALLVFCFIGISSAVRSSVSDAATTAQPIVGIAGKCLDNYANKVVDKNPIILYRCNQSEAQKWTVNDDGTIRNRDFCLDVKGASKAERTYVQLYHCNGSVAQKWVVNSNQTIVNPNSGLCLDDQYANTNDKNPIWMYRCNGSVAQKWVVLLAPQSAPVSASSPTSQPATSAPAPTPTPSTATPSGSNTGVPVGTNLTVHNGDLNITTAGTVVDGKDIRGLVKINAANVTIKNSIIRGRALTGTAPLINNLGGQSGLKITDTELFPSIPSPYAMGIYGYNFTATRVNIHGVIDGIHLTGGNVVIERSWLHDNLHYASDPNHGGTPSHDDSIQIQKGDNIRVVGNNISGAFNSGVQITQDTGRVSNFTFTNNYANGGGCTVNIAEKSYGPVMGVRIADNTFGRDTKLSNCAVIAKSTTKIDLLRNYYAPDGATVTVRKG